MSESTQDETWVAEQISSLEEFFPQAELLPELQQHLMKSDFFCKSSFDFVLHHPLVIGAPYTPAMNHHYNQQYLVKKEAALASATNGDYEQYVFLHERPYRALAFAQLNKAVNMTDKEYWSLAGSIWVDSENVRESQHIWDEIFESDRPGRHWLMEHEEIAALLEMPEKLTLYQGCTEDRDDGWSWTTSIETAKWFANRFSLLESSWPVIRTVTVDREDVLAYFTRRGENEVLVHPLLTDHSEETQLPREGV